MLNWRSESAVLIVPLFDAREGMALAATVTHPDQPGQELLKAGFVLTSDVIKRLADLGVEVVFIDYPDLGDLDKQLMPYLSPERERIYKQMKQTMVSVQKTSSPSVNFTDYYDSTRDLITTLLNSGQNPVYLDVMSAKLGAGAVAHATAVAHLALVLGIRLENYLIQQRSRLTPRHAKEVVNLGVAGMLHDIGTARLPAALQKHSRIDLPAGEESAQWQEHVRFGYEMVKEGAEPTAAAAILHHHQHFDGSGFPAAIGAAGKHTGYSGERIHIFARIVAAADLYDRLTITDKGVRRQNIQVLHLMQTQYKDWIDPTVLAALPGVVPPFPPGLKVVLNDGTEAVTVAIKSERPYRPTVRRVIEPGSFKLAAEGIDLSRPENAGIKIAKVGGVDARPLIPLEKGMIRGGQGGVKVGEKVGAGV